MYPRSSVVTVRWASLCLGKSGPSAGQNHWEVSSLMTSGQCWPWMGLSPGCWWEWLFPSLSKWSFYWANVCRLIARQLSRRSKCLRLPRIPRLLCKTTCYDLAPKTMQHCICLTAASWRIHGMQQRRWDTRRGWGMGSITAVPWDCTICHMLYFQGWKKYDAKINVL